MVVLTNGGIQMKTRLFVSAALLCVLTAACGRGGNVSVANNAATTAPAANVTAAAPAAPASNNAQAAVPANPSQNIELVEDGFTSGSVGLHHNNMIRFGQPQAQVVEQVTAILGSPSETGRNNDCPSGAVDFVNYGSLGLHFEGGRFVGWVLDGPSPALETYHGLAVGTQRSALVDELAAEVDSNSTLGTEVSVNGVGALLSGPGPEARVTNLFSGVTCFAR